MIPVHRSVSVRLPDRTDLFNFLYEIFRKRLKVVEFGPNVLDVDEIGGAWSEYRYDHDNDGIWDASDLDDDNDGLSDWFENNDGNDFTGQFDHDNDGVSDYLDDDDDGDGILDEFES